MRNGLLISYWWLAGPLRGAPVAPSGEYSPVHPPPSPSLLANVIGFTLVDQRKPCSLYSFGGIQNYTLKQLPKKSPSFQMLYWTIYFSFFTFDVLSFRSWFRPEQWSSNWFYCLHTFDPPSKSYCTMSLMIKRHTFLVTLSL